MATTEPRSEQEVTSALRDERRRLAASLDELRTELHEKTDVRGRLDATLGGVLPVAIAAAAGAGFVLGGGIGATVRLFLRRSREGRVKAQAGRFAVVDRG